MVLHEMSMGRTEASVCCSAVLTKAQKVATFYKKHHNYTSQKQKSEI